MFINFQRGRIADSGGESRLAFTEFRISRKDQQGLVSRWRQRALIRKPPTGIFQFRGFSFLVANIGFAIYCFLVGDPAPGIGHGSQQIHAKEDCRSEFIKHPSHASQGALYTVVSHYKGLFELRVVFVPVYLSPRQIR